MNLSINTEREEKRVADFIKNVLAKTNASGVVVASSGGVDSATVLTLTARAIGKEKTHALLLPYGNLSATASILAKDVIKNLGLPEKNVKTIEITPIVSAT